MITLRVHRRTITGKKVRQLRKQGILPAVVYGSHLRSESLELPLSAFLKVWKNAGESSIIELKIENGPTKSVLIHDIAFDPREDVPMHVDFYEAERDKLLRVRVGLSFIGESEAVTALGGVLVKVLHELEVEALPKDLPHELSVDISKLKTFDDHIVVGDIDVPAGSKLLGDESQLVAKVVPPLQEEAEAAPPAEVDLGSIEVAKRGKREKDLAADEAPKTGE